MGWVSPTAGGVTVVLNADTGQWRNATRRTGEFAKAIQNLQDQMAKLGTNVAQSLVPLGSLYTLMKDLSELKIDTSITANTAEANKALTKLLRDSEKLRQALGAPIVIKATAEEGKAAARAIAPSSMEQTLLNAATGQQAALDEANKSLKSIDGKLDEVIGAIKDLGTGRPTAKQGPRRPPKKPEDIAGNLTVKSAIDKVKDAVDKQTEAVRAAQKPAKPSEEILDLSELMTDQTTQITTAVEGLSKLTVQPPKLQTIIPPEALATNKKLDEVKNVAATKAVLTTDRIVDGVEKAADKAANKIIASIVDNAADKDLIRRAARGATAEELEQRITERRTGRRMTQTDVDREFGGINLETGGRLTLTGLQREAPRSRRGRLAARAIVEPAKEFEPGSSVIRVEKDVRDLQANVKRLAAATTAIIQPHQRAVLDTERLRTMMPGEFTTGPAGKSLLNAIRGIWEKGSEWVRKEFPPIYGRERAERAPRERLPEEPRTPTKITQFFSPWIAAFERFRQTLDIEEIAKKTVAVGAAPQKIEGPYAEPRTVPQMPWWAVRPTRVTQALGIEQKPYDIGKTKPLWVTEKQWTTAFPKKEPTEEQLAKRTADVKEAQAKAAVQAVNELTRAKGSIVGETLDIDDLIDKLLKKVIGSRQEGGEVPKTGPYLLHAGEKVTKKGVVGKDFEEFHREFQKLYAKFEKLVQSGKVEQSSFQRWYQQQAKVAAPSVRNLSVSTSGLTPQRSISQATSDTQAMSPPLQALRKKLDEITGARPELLQAPVQIPQPQAPAQVPQAPQAKPWRLIPEELPPIQRGRIPTAPATTTIPQPTIPRPETLGTWRQFATGSISQPTVPIGPGTPLMQAAMMRSAIRGGDRLGLAARADQRGRERAARQAAEAARRARIATRTATRTAGGGREAAATVAPTSELSKAVSQGLNIALGPLIGGTNIGQILTRIGKYMALMTASVVSQPTDFRTLARSFQGVRDTLLGFGFWGRLKKAIVGPVSPEALQQAAGGAPKSTTAAATEAVTKTATTVSSALVDAWKKAGAAKPQPQPTQQQQKTIWDRIETFLGKTLNFIGSLFGGGAGGGGGGGTAVAGAGAATQAGAQGVSTAAMGAAVIVTGAIVAISLAVQVITGILKLILKAITGVFDIFLKASPLLKAMVDLLEMGFLMMIKPIADFFALLLRPLVMILFMLLRPFLKDMVPILRKFANDTKAAFGLLSGDLDATGGAFIDAMVTAATEFIDAATPVFEALGERLAVVMEKVVIPLIERMQPVLMKLVDDIVVPLLTTLTPVATTLLTTIITTLTPVVLSLIDAFTEVITSPKMQEALGNLIAAVFESGGKVVGAISGALVTIILKLGDDLIAAILRGLSELWSSFWKMIMGEEGYRQSQGTGEALPTTTTTINNVTYDLTPEELEQLRSAGLLPSKQAGGAIGQTGPYQLHAGEYVLSNPATEMLATLIKSGEMLREVSIQGFMTLSRLVQELFMTEQQLLKVTIDGYQMTMKGIYELATAQRTGPTIQQDITVTPQISIGNVSSNVDLDKLTESVSRGISESFRRRGGLII